MVLRLMWSILIDDAIDGGLWFWLWVSSFCAMVGFIAAVCLATWNGMMMTGVFFHGTNVDLNVGDRIVAGVNVDKDHGRSNHVYMTHSSSGDSGSDEYLGAVSSAYAWARVACADAVESSCGDEGDVFAFVYLVKPFSGVEYDTEDNEDGFSVRTVGDVVIVGAVDHYDLELCLPFGFVGQKFLDI